MFTTRILIVVVLLLTGNSFAQTYGELVVDPMAGIGEIKENVYDNTYFGFTYEFPKKWDVRWGPEQVAVAGCGSDCRLFEVQDPRSPASIQLRAYPLQGNAPLPQFIKKTVLAEPEQLGMKSVGPVTEFEAAGWKFYRAEYKSQLINSALFHTFMVTSGRNHILVFTLIGTSRNEMGALAAGLTPRQMQAAHQRTAE